jgi:hypothetical protein
MEGAHQAALMVVVEQRVVLVHSTSQMQSIPLQVQHHRKTTNCKSSTQEHTWSYYTFPKCNLGSQR